MNDWDNYVIWTRETAQYPEVGTGSHLVLAYLALGLIGEVAETLEAYETSKSDREHLLDELGDGYWYVARFDDEFSLGCNVTGKPKRSSPGAIYKADRLLGKLANDTKKVLREDSAAGDRMDCVMNHVIKIALEMRAFSESWLFEGQSFHKEVLVRNMNKLMDRKHRNVIKGSGDNR